MDLWTKVSNILVGVVLLAVLAAGAVAYFSGTPTNAPVQGPTAPAPTTGGKKFYTE